MNLQVKHITLHNFRNYEEFSLDFSGALTVITGPNAIGKTNIIEGIQLLTSHTTFRNANVVQLLHQGTKTGRLTASVLDGNRDLLIELRLEDTKKKYLLNGKNKKISSLKGLVPSVIFTPDDLVLVKGSMTLRRRSIDILGSQLSANYYRVLRDYEKVIQNKNKLLKESSSPSLIEALDEMIIKIGSQLSIYRLTIFKQMAIFIKDYYRELSHGSEILKVRYSPTWVSEKESIFYQEEFSREEAQVLIEKKLYENKKEEYIRKRSLVGPHTDKIDFYINEKNAAFFGSQGQQRSIVLAYKLAEAALIQEILNQKPILLLDDVLSELDENRRSALLDFVQNNNQTFITTAHTSYFSKSFLTTAQLVDLRRAY